MKKLQLLEGIVELLFLLLVVWFGRHCGNSKEVNRKRDGFTGQDFRIRWMGKSTVG